MKSSFLIKAAGYAIHIGKDALPSLQQQLTSGDLSAALHVVLADVNTAQHCLPVLHKKVPALKEAPVIIIPAGEQSKNIGETVRIWQELINLRTERNAVLINLGGGVISDIGGFAASVYKRGIPDRS